MTNAQFVRTKIKTYAQDTRGNFAAMAAGCALMLMAAIGVAMDTSGMVGKSKALQDMLDNAVLTAASSGETKKKKLRRAAKDSMKVNNTHNWKVKTNIDVVDDEIIATASTIYEPVIMGMFRKGPITVRAKSAAPIAQNIPLNISLVLDTTDSMAGSNITDMQKAAERLVQVIDRSKNPDTRIAVVPFGNYVNIGKARRNETWMNVLADGTLGPERSCYEEVVRSATGCTPGTETRYRDGVPYTAEVETGCTYTSTPTGNTICPPPNVLNWNGCAGSRDAPHNIMPEASATNPIGGAMNEWCGQELLPLTTNMASVRTKISNLTTTGSTHIPSGLLWGWRTLSPTTPFTEVTSAPENSTRAIVLMTDGANTMAQRSRYDSPEELYHREYSPSDVSADKHAIERIENICEGIKDDNIKVFTVAYKLPAGSTTTSTALKDCASSPAYAFKAKNSKQLKRTFENIAQNLMVVRLSK